MQQVTVNDVLVEARRLLVTVGWCQDKSCERDDNGQICAYCLTGTIQLGGKRLMGLPLETDTDACPVIVQAFDRADLALADYIKRPIEIWMWNDEVTRKQSEVIAFLDTIIKKD